MKRPLTSLVVVARANHQTGTADRAVASALRSYRSHLSDFVEAAELDIWYDVTHVHRLLDAFTEPEVRDRVSAHIDKKAR